MCAVLYQIRFCRRLNSGFGAPSWRRSTSRDTEGSFGSPDWSSNNTLPRGNI